MKIFQTYLFGGGRGSQSELGNKDRSSGGVGDNRGGLRIQSVWLQERSHKAWFCLQSIEEVAGSEVIHIKIKSFFPFFDSTRFPSLEECYETFDNIRTNRCPYGPQIEEEGNIHICASSLAGDFCNGDSGSGLVILDKNIR